jgi:hypothetical protein
VSLETPIQPEIIGTYLWEADYNDIDFSFPRQILVNGDYIYVPFERFGNSESFIISIEDPTQPEIIEFEDIQGLAHPLAMEDILLIANFELYNIEDPLHPELLTVLGDWYDKVWTVSIQHGLVVIGGWSGAHDFINIRMFNVRDPENPMLIAEIELPESVNHVILDDGVVYVQGYSGIEIMQYTGADGVNEPALNQPLTFELSEPYPNPFNSTTLMSYTLPKSADVRLSLYDTAGRLVSTLVEVQQTAGRYQYTLNGADLSAGVYLLRLEVGEAVRTQKVVLLK